MIGMTWSEINFVDKACDSRLDASRPSREGTITGPRSVDAD